MAQYRAAILAWGGRDDADTVLASALHGLGDVEPGHASAVALPGGSVSVVLTFPAADDEAAAALAQAAAAATGRSSSTASGQVESLSTGRGRSHRRVAL